MLTILRSLVDEMVSIANLESPIECCGVIAGPEDSNIPLRHVPMKNIANSDSFFEFDSKDQLKLWREMDENDEEPVVIYHSHTNSRAYPSKEDVSFAQEPKVHYVIIPTNLEFDSTIRSFRIVSGKVTEERVNIVDSYSMINLSNNQVMDSNDKFCKTIEAV